MPFEAGMKIEFVPTRTIMDLTAVPRLMLEKLIISFAENEIIPKYKAITDSFDTHHPEFGIIESNVSANLVSMLVYVTDDDELSSDGAIFRYVDEGTSRRKALLSRDWISKTSPGSTAVGEGAGSVVKVSDDFDFPGIEKRGFTDIIYDEVAPLFFSRADAIFNSITNSLGQGFIKERYAGTNVLSGSNWLTKVDAQTRIELARMGGLASGAARRAKKGN